MKSRKVGVRARKVTYANVRKEKNKIGVTGVVNGVCFEIKRKRREDVGWMDCDRK